VLKPPAECIDRFHGTSGFGRISAANLTQELGIVSAQTSTLIGAETGFATATWDAGRCPLYPRADIPPGLVDQLVA
jgi:hypothetical protein